jgi:hypothetical protein
MKIKMLTMYRTGSFLKICLSLGKQLLLRNGSNYGFYFLIMLSYLQNQAQFDFQNS